MAYWLDDGFDTWPEVVRVGKAAAGLYVCCGAWISRNISSGNIADAVIPAEVAAMYGTPEWVTKLVAAGLWRTEEAGYRDVRYFAMPNPTAEKAAKQKSLKAERQRRWLEKTHQRRVSGRSKDATRDASQDMPPSLPPSKEGTGRAPASRGAARDPETQHPADDRLVDWDDPLARAEREEELRLASEQAVRDRIEADRIRREGKARALAAAGLAAPKHAAPDPPTPPEPPPWDGTTRQLPLVTPRERPA